MDNIELSAAYERMSPYERREWDAAVERVNRERDGRIRKAVGSLTTPVRQRAGRAWAAVPMHEDLEQQVLKALSGFKALTFDPSLRSVDASKPLRRHEVDSIEGLFDLDLRDLDRAMPVLRGAYAGVAAIEGGASALVITGAEVSATVSGGVTIGVVAAAIAADTATSMALLGRVIGRVAAEYGYDVRLPEEETFALGVLSMGSAASAAEKAAALASLRRLTAQMMRQATWAELNHHALVQAIKRVYGLLGERLTKRKLAQAVPVAGAVINAGMSAQMVDSTYRAARDVYRLRFLSEKYNIDPAAWVVVTESATPGASDALDVALDELEADGRSATETSS